MELDLNGFRGNNETPVCHPAQAKAFILDWDGVLVDTRLNFKPLRQKYFENIQTQGGRARSAASQSSLAPPRPPSGVFPLPVPLLEAAATLSEPLRGEVLAEIRGIEIEGAERAAPVEGAKDLIAWLTGRLRPWAVVSRNCLDSITLAAERCGIDLPSVLLSREDPYVKPDPRALTLAAEKLGVNLSDCVMVGDFVYDLQAARNAGIPSVLVRGSGAEWECLADFSYPSVKDFVEALETFAPRP
ncbi:MAG: HAD family hydrolase [Synergistaceae bacterium]|jgi:phosphoglycolate phosphatase-like HAD superfamily hydrolase|nr:HAD family hydrolase [Synergistaceae bacterium]